MRTHIRVEQQLKLHIEGMQQQFDEILARTQAELEDAQKEAQEAKEAAGLDRERAVNKVQEELRDLKVKFETAKKENEDQFK